MWEKENMKTKEKLNIVYAIKASHSKDKQLDTIMPIGYIHNFFEEEVEQEAAV